MRCLIVVPSLRRAGAETQAVDLANGLAQRGHVVHVFSFLPETEQESRFDSSVRFHHSLRRSKFATGFVRDLARIVDGEDIDVIHSVMQFSALVSWIAIRLSARKPRHVVAIHTTTNYDWKSEFADRYLYTYVLRAAAKVVFVCRHQREHWIRKYPFLKRKSVVVYNGVDPAFFDPNAFEQSAGELRERLEIGQDAFVFCCIAAFRPEKGHDLLLQAFSEMPGNSVLILAGDGEMKAPTEKLARRLDIQKRLRWLGNIPGVRPLLAASDITVLASTAVETFSIAMLESLAMRTPMIAPKIGGLAEAIVDGKTGWLFPAGDGAALSDRMRSAMEVGSALADMGNFGRDSIMREFGVEKMIVESESVLMQDIETTL